MEKYTPHINSRNVHYLRISITKYVQENYKTGVKACINGKISHFSEWQTSKLWRCEFSSNWPMHLIFQLKPLNVIFCRTWQNNLKIHLEK